MRGYETTNSEYGRWIGTEAKHEIVTDYMEQERKFHEDFNSFDTDHSGYIELKELESALKKARPGVDPAFLNQVATLTLQNADRNRDGKLNYDEFVAAHNQLMDLMQPEMRPGDIVLAVGLVERSELNGKKIVLVAFNPTKQRWHAKLAATGERMALKPENVQRDEGGSATDSSAEFLAEFPPGDLPAGSSTPPTPGSTLDTESLTMVLRGKVADKFADVRSAFRAIDENSSGTISAVEFGQVLLNASIFVPDDQLQAVLRRYDKNGDGRVDYLEFCAFMDPDTSYIPEQRPRASTPPKVAFSESTKSQ